MREINAAQITQVVKKLCIDANCHLTGDVKDCIRDCRACESWAAAQEILDRIIENFEIADEKDQPVCQEAVGKMSEIAQAPLEGIACVCQVNPSSMM